MSKLFDVEDPVRGKSDLFSGGWIKVHRKILFHPFFQDSELLHLFLYCMAKANHRDGKLLLKGQDVTIKRGQFIFGRKKATEETGIKQSSVYRKMMILRNLEILDIKPNNKFSLVTVHDYDKYQDVPSSFEQQTGQRLNNKRTTSEQQLNTNKNNKNEKNDKKKRIFPPLSIEYDISKFLLTEIRKNDHGFLVDNPEAEESTIQRWAAEADRLMRIDHRSAEEIEAVIGFAQSNSFWKPSILSMAKVREKYTALLLQMESQSEGTYSPKPHSKLKGAPLPCEVII